MLVEIYDWLTEGFDATELKHFRFQLRDIRNLF